MPSAVTTILICAFACTPVQAFVYDGDTFRVGGRSVRLAGIDTPERGHRAHCLYEAGLAEHALDELARLLEGKRIEIIPAGKDKYGRVLANVTADGQDVASAMKLARPYGAGRKPWCRVSH